MSTVKMDPARPLTFILSPTEGEGQNELARPSPGDNFFVADNLPALLYPHLTPHSGGAGDARLVVTDPVNHTSHTG